MMKRLSIVIALLLAISCVGAGIIYLSAVSFTSTGVLFANLNTFLPGGPTNGTVVYCKDCTISPACAGGGTGAIAEYLNNTWNCGNVVVTGGSVNTGLQYQDPFYGQNGTTLSPVNALTISVLKYGAKCDGSTDDSTAFTNAMTAVNSAGGVLSIPAGTCVVNSTLTISHGGVVISGAGWKATKLTTSTANLPQIVAQNPATDWQVRDIWLTRSATATSPGDGIDGCLTTAACNNPVIQNVMIDSAYDGIKLGAAAYGAIRNVVSQSNQHEGIFLQGQSYTSGNSLQWTIWNALSQLNAQHGFNALANTAGGPGTLGPWHDAYTFANGTGGVVIAGAGAAVLSDIQIVGGFFGSDCADEINVNSNGGGAVVIADNLIETPGQHTCGVGLGTAATHIGDGIHLSSTTTDVMISGNRVQVASFSCIETASPRITITGNMLFDCGQASVAGNLDGIVVSAASVDANITGNEMDLNNGYGIRQTGGTVNMTGNVCIGNVVGTHVGTIASNTGGAC